MTNDETVQLLSDHVDMRPVAVDADEAIADRNAIVQLDPDHPGFRDREYRARRNQIAQIAMKYHPRDPIPDAPYTNEEHQVWSVIWQALRPAHQKHACSEYLSALNRLTFDPIAFRSYARLMKRCTQSAAFASSPSPVWFSRASSSKI